MLIAGTNGWVLDADFLRHRPDLDTKLGQINRSLTRIRRWTTKEDKFKATICWILGGHFIKGDGYFPPSDSIFRDTFYRKNTFCRLCHIAVYKHGDAHFIAITRQNRNKYKGALRVIERGGISKELAAQLVKDMRIMAHILESDEEKFYACLKNSLEKKGLEIEFHIVLYDSLIFYAICRYIEKYV